MKAYLILWFAFLVVLLSAGPTSRADDMFIWVEEVGGNVIFFHEGSIDLSGFPMKSVVTATALIAPDSCGYANSNADVDIYSMVLPLGTTRPFGTGGIQFPDSVFGEYFGLGNADELGVPMDYVSGTPISGSMTFLSTDLATLGVTPTPFSFNTTVGSNTIHMFTNPTEVAAAQAAALVAAQSDLLRKTRKLEKKARKAKKKGQLAKAKKLKRKVKKLEKQLTALG